MGAHTPRHTHPQTQTHTHTHTHTQKHTHTHNDIMPSLAIHPPQHTHIQTNTHTPAQTHTHTHTHTYKCTCMYPHTHTSTHLAEVIMGETSQSTNSNNIILSFSVALCDWWTRGRAATHTDPRCPVDREARVQRQAKRSLHALQSIVQNGCYDPPASHNPAWFNQTESKNRLTKWNIAHAQVFYQFHLFFVLSLTDCPVLKIICSV